MRSIALLSFTCYMLCLPAFANEPSQTDDPGRLKALLAEARLQAEKDPLPVSRKPASASERLQKILHTEKTISTAPPPVQKKAALAMPDEMMDASPSAPVASRATPEPVATAKAASTQPPAGKQILASISDRDDAVTAPAAVPAPLAPAKKKTDTKTRAAAQVKTPETAPKAAVAPKTAYLDLPQAMPEQKKLVLDQKDMVPATSTHENIPAIPVPVPVPSHALAQAQAPRTPAARITAPESTATGAWKIRLVAARDKVDAFCVMENSFSNNLGLMIGQRADGYSTLGIDYGIDMLTAGKNYSALVQLDQHFEENFNAVAQNGRLLVVHLGKKPSLFALLGQTANLRVAFPGSGSSFALQGIAGALEDFGKCLGGIGGALPAVQAVPVLANNRTMPAIPAAPVASADLDETILDDQPIASRPAAAVAPSVVPVLPTTMQPAKTASAPQVPMQAPTATSAANVVPPAQAAALVASQTIVAPYGAPVISLPQPVPASEWSAFIHAILRRAGLDIDSSSFKQGGAAKDWSLHHGKVKAEVWRIPANDLMNAALAQVDVNDDACHGAFSNQLGTPEELDGNIVQLMETKCVTGDNTTIATWLLQQSQSGITAWRMTAPQAYGAQAFEARARLLAAMQQPSGAAALQP